MGLTQSRRVPQISLSLGATRRLGLMPVRMKQIYLIRIEGHADDEQAPWLGSHGTAGPAQMLASEGVFAM
jgi:hypothetical protein